MKHLNIFSNVEIAKAKKTARNVLAINIVMFIALIISLTYSVQWLFNIYAATTMSFLAMVVFSTFIIYFLYKNSTDAHFKSAREMEESEASELKFYSILRDIYLTSNTFPLINTVCRALSVLVLIILAATGHFIVFSAVFFTFIVGTCLNLSSKHFTPFDYFELKIKEANEKSI